MNEGSVLDDAGLKWEGWRAGRWWEFTKLWNGMVLYRCVVADASAIDGKACGGPTHVGRLLLDCGNGGGYHWVFDPSPLEVQCLINEHRKHSNPEGNHDTSTHTNNAARQVQAGVGGVQDQDEAQPALEHREGYGGA